MTDNELFKYREIDGFHYAKIIYMFYGMWLYGLFLLLFHLEYNVMRSLNVYKKKKKISSKSECSSGTRIIQQSIECLNIHK